MGTSIAPENLHELRILEQIERDPEATQADLAARHGELVREAVGEKGAH